MNDPKAALEALMRASEKTESSEKTIVKDSIDSLKKSMTDRFFYPYKKYGY